jgi:hypothetical protein
MVAAAVVVVMVVVVVELMNIKRMLQMKKPSLVAPVL